MQAKQIDPETERLACVIWRTFATGFAGYSPPAGEWKRRYRLWRITPPDETDALMNLSIAAAHAVQAVVEADALSPIRA